MTSSEHLLPSGTGFRSDTDAGKDHVNRAVEEAQTEMDRLISSLAEDEQLPEVQDSGPEIEELEARIPPPARSGPVYLIISSKQRLKNKYGRSGFKQIDEDLRDLSDAIQTRHDLEVVTAYIDDEQSLMRFGLDPVDPANPWQVKKSVDSVDNQVSEEGRQVRHVLIVGGDHIIPFHRLPNPVDDQDSDVPSDNPYACRDGNYLVPERAVGRMPDGANVDVGFLRSIIQTSAAAHRQRAVSKGLLSTLTVALGRLRRPSGNGSGLGYSASVWRKASRAVFHLIGDASHLRTSPPLTYEGFQVVDPPHLSYFNLHGIEDGPNWYGQRDALFPADYPLFPLALRPQDPSISDHKNAVVFTEACYGANILGKDPGNSIALSFLSAQALAVVGSTKVSYGSIAPPLLGADLVGRYYWEGLRDGLTIGEALQHAKVAMANEMQTRQGYLDDEDQKALISFVLYGDPSLSITSIHRRASPVASPEFFCPPIICSKNAGRGKAIASDELVTKVKARIETSLPHMSQARVWAKPLALWIDECEKSCVVHDGKTGRSDRSAKARKGLTKDGRGWALTLRKDIRITGDGKHHQVVRVVVDESGHIRKMVVSK